MHLDLRCNGRNSHRDRRGLGVEAHRHQSAATSPPGPPGALGRAAIPGRLAEQPVERHRCGRQADHADDHRAQQQHGGAVAVWLSAAPFQPPLIRTMLIT
jgi:hypothetical protein